MRVIVQIMSGPMAGRKIWLNAGQTLSVGRTEASDWTVPQDALMSAAHFAVELQLNACRIRDLGSSNGTFVNGQRVDEVIAQDGMQILAGQTNFIVRIEGAGAPSHPGIEAPVAPSKAITSPPVTAARVSPTTGPIPYKVFSCHSQLILLRGTQSKFQAGEIANRLVNLAPPWLITLPQKMRSTVPDQNFKTERLFLGLEDEVAHAYSPTLLGPLNREPVAAVVASNWGCNGVFGLYSMQERSDLIEQMRELGFGCRPANEHIARIAAEYFGPSYVVEWLANGPPDRVSRILTGVEAVLLEVHGGDRWAILCRPNTRAALEKLSIVAAPDWKD